MLGSYISEMIGHLENMTQRVIIFYCLLQVVCRVLSDIQVQFLHNAKRLHGICRCRHPVPARL